MIARWNKRTGHCVLALALDRDRVAAVELRRTNGHAEIRASVEAPLEVNPFTGNPEAAGLSLRKALDTAGIRERHCTIALPQDLVLALPIAIPDIPDTDLESFLQIEAERGFPQNPEDLLVRTSLGNPSPNHRHAMCLGIPMDILTRLESVLRAARLQPHAFTLATTALQPPSDPASSGVLALLPTGSSLAVQLTHEGSVAALRVIDGAFSSETTPPDFHADHVLRELRITLGQLPADIRDAVRRVRVFGRSDAARLTATTLAPRLAPLGLLVEQVSDLPPLGQPFQLPTDAPASAALAVAVATAVGLPATLNFLPPRVSAWQQFSQRYASRRLAGASVAAGAVVGLTALVFLGQQILLWQWQGRWDSIKTRVTKLESVQKEIRVYRPWFDESFRSLGVLRRLTESFPEDGTVTAKTIELRPNGRVVCSGTARDTQSWLRMLDQMRNAPGITDVQVEQVRGKSPLEFTFNFRWEGSGGS